VASPDVSRLHRWGETLDPDAVEESLAWITRPILADVESLSGRERARFERMPLWGPGRSLLREAAERARRAHSPTRTIARPRERRARRSTRTAARGDPPEPEPPPPLTPLQRAQLSFLEALVVATEGGPRTYLTFLDLAATRIAAEGARVAEEWPR
jgi:hypothetical protein